MYTVEIISDASIVSPVCGTATVEMDSFTAFRIYWTLKNAGVSVRLWDVDKKHAVSPSELKF